MIKESLKKYRQEKGISQRELGRQVGISGQYIAQLERGEKTNPSAETLEKLATALDIQASDLLARPKMDYKLFAEHAKNVDLADQSISNISLVAWLTSEGYDISHYFDNESEQEAIVFNHHGTCVAFMPSDLDTLTREVLKFIDFSIYKQSLLSEPKKSN